MHDTLRHVQSAPVASLLADAFEVTPARAEAALRCVMSELAWHLERNTLSRRGLADLVEALGSGHHAGCLGEATAIRAETVRADGNAILRHILGAEDHSRSLATRVSRAAGLGEQAAASMLPALAVVAMARLAADANKALAEVLVCLPPLGSLSRGGPHADLADILRRGCGAGPYAPARLRRVVRRALSRAAGFPPRGAARWYLHFMVVRPLSRPARAIVERATAPQSAPSHD
jgi:hypothetical protein